MKEQADSHAGGMVFEATCSFSAAPAASGSFTYGVACQTSGCLYAGYMRLAGGAGNSV